MRLYLLLLLMACTAYVKSGKAVDLFTKYKSKFLGKITGKKGDNLEKCNIAIKNGKPPSAENSPLETFGFPFFNEKGKQIEVKPGVTLSYIGKFYQPIKLGSRDYVISGFAAEFLAFFDCFKDYDIFGSYLAPDGHWKNETGTTESLKVQIQNTAQNTQGMNSELWEMIFKITLENLAKYLAPKTVILQQTEAISGIKPGTLTKASDFLDYLEKAKNYLPIGDPIPFLEKINELRKEKDEKKKLKAFLDFVKEMRAKKKLGKLKWSNWKNVNKDDKIVMTITMYEKPDSTVRATYDMGKVTVKVKDVGDAFKMFLLQDKA